MRATDTITVDGKKIKVALNMATFFEMKTRFGIGLNDLDTHLQPMTTDADGNEVIDELAAAVNITQLAYCAAVNAYALKGEEFTMNFLQFKALVLEDPTAVLETMGTLLHKAFTPPSETDSGNE